MVESLGAVESGELRVERSAPPLSTLNSPFSTISWYCLRTHSKHEHIAGDWIQRFLGIETYAPRIRFRRARPSGLAWFIEALFPNYLFARFELGAGIQKVEAAPGIRRVVRFGRHCPIIPEEVIQALRASIGAEAVRVIDEQFVPGETVEVAGGAFHGLEAVVTRVMPGRQRVGVLLDFLGRQTLVEISSAQVVRTTDERRSVFQ